MSVFTDDELAYLTGGERRLARIATVGPDGLPHVVPGGYRYDPVDDVVELRGIGLARTKRWRDVRHTGRIALVVDDVLPPWQPRAVEIRGLADAIDGDDPVIRVRPTRVVSWGLNQTRGVRSVRDVS